MKIVYDGDGNRVSETVAGVTTKYLVADQNLTGYAQVMDELQGTAVPRTYSYGLELINERQTISGTPKTSFYGYDSHGSVRFLTDSTGAVTDSYDYDAFGNMVSQAGTTPNNYLFAGEQFDPVLGVYYNRAGKQDVISEVEALDISVSMDAITVVSEGAVIEVVEAPVAVSALQTAVQWALTTLAFAAVLVQTGDNRPTDKKKDEQPERHAGVL